MANKLVAPKVKARETDYIVVEMPRASRVNPSSTSDTDSAHEGRYRKEKIPKAVREQLWRRDVGEKFWGKCKTSWCRNDVNVWDYQCGHNIPESKGGETSLDNLVVLCSRCNNSMSNNYTFKEWEAKFHPRPRRTFISRLFHCFS